MKTGRLLTWLLIGVAISCAIGASVATGGGGKPVASGGDPNQISPDRLRSELDDIGISIRYSSSENTTPVTLIGVAQAESVEIGFEFQIFGGSDEATVRNLGQLRPQDFDWPPETRMTGLDSNIRGVLANVAYAQYELDEIADEAPPRGVYLREDSAHREASRALDDALFSTLPPGDPYAHAALGAP